MKKYYKKLLNSLRKFFKEPLLQKCLLKDIWLNRKPTRDVIIVFRTDRNVIWRGSMSKQKLGSIVWSDFTLKKRKNELLRKRGVRSSKRASIHSLPTFFHKTDLEVFTKSADKQMWFFWKMVVKSLFDLSLSAVCQNPEIFDVFAHLSGPCKQKLLQFFTSHDQVRFSMHDCTRITTTSNKELIKY